MDDGGGSPIGSVGRLVDLPTLLGKLTYPQVNNSWFVTADMFTLIFIIITTKINKQKSINTNHLELQRYLVFVLSGSFQPLNP